MELFSKLDLTSKNMHPKGEKIGKKIETKLFC